MTTSPDAPADRGSTWAWFLLPVAILGLTVVGVLALFPDGEILAPVFGMRSAPFPGEAVFRFEKAGRYHVYRSEPKARKAGPATWQDGNPTPDLELTVTLVATGEPLPLESVTMDATVDTDRHYRAIRRFELPAPGEVKVVGAYPAGVTGPEQIVGVGPALEFGRMFGSIGRIILCAFVGFFGGAGAIAIFIVLLVKRSGRQRLMPTPPAG